MMAVLGMRPKTAKFRGHPLRARTRARASREPCDDPGSCAEPTKPTKEGWRCEACGQGLEPGTGSARWLREQSEAGS